MFRSCSDSQPCQFQAILEANLTLRANRRRVARGFERSAYDGRQAQPKGER